MVAHKTDKSFPVWTVSELNQKTGRLLEEYFSLVWVTGEISNFKQYDSGHCYFSLKDSLAQVRCVMFRAKAQQLDFMPRDGMEVEVLALPSLYPARGDFQLLVESMRRAGLGALFVEFEKLKAKLEKEGLFAAAGKRPLPTFPRVVGIVTSPKGAAVQDMLTTLQRRFPALQIIIYPAMVQGIQAVPDLVRALGQAAARNEVDVLIIGRGGGSIEDLWAFNDEAVARSIAALPMPVVSAVGHETDFTIADFVADVRAPTPTAAAEMVSPDRRHWQQRLQQYRGTLSRQMQHYLSNVTQCLDMLSRQLISPARKLSEQRIRLRHLAWQLQSCQKQLLQQKKQQATFLQARLQHCLPRINVLQQQLRYNRQRLEASVNNSAQKHSYHLQALEARLAGLDPTSILARGYSLVTDQDGKIVRSTRVLQIGTQICLHLAEGGADATITRIDPADTVVHQDKLPL